MFKHLLIGCLVVLAGGAQAETKVERGEYLVNLLSCAYCHTEGALVGRPDPKRYLSGSSIGIAYTPFKEPDLPAVVFARNLTSDQETGLGDWSAAEIKRVIVSGVDKHGRRQLPVMPWPGYAFIRDEDLDAIVAYLQSLAPVRFAPPAQVAEGQKSDVPWVRFGVYEFKPDGMVEEHGIDEVRPR